MGKIAINGLGRIGRAAFKILLDTPEVEVAAVNDLVPLDNLVYLLRYDTVYGRYEEQVWQDGPKESNLHVVMHRLSGKVCFM